ncbi:hypothetical protein [Amycolatopsis sp. NPDC001319]|uniref:hypothetical protein n=1 Tax=unclassified Amycolatopsis TaxID=2618356 RepID=UPI0036756588
MSPDRYGEPDDEAPEHDERCRNGWLDRDADPAVPCLICKPHLAPALLRRSTLDADQLRQEPRNPEGTTDA